MKLKGVRDLWGCRTCFYVFGPLSGFTGPRASGRPLRFVTSLVPSCVDHTITSSRLLRTCPVVPTYDSGPSVPLCFITTSSVEVSETELTTPVVGLVALKIFEGLKSVSTLRGDNLL